VIDKKELKKRIKYVIDCCEGNCSVALNYTNSGIHVFAEISGVQVSWCRGSAILYVPSPGAITFVIPYDAVTRYVLDEKDKALEIDMEGRQVIQIGKIKEWTGV